MGVTTSASMPIEGLKTFSLQKPESTTYLMPSTVSDVSAMFVQTTHLRIPFGVFANTSDCFDALCSEYMGSISSGEVFFSILLMRSFTSYPSVPPCNPTSHTHSMSLWPVMNTRISPSSHPRWIVRIWFTTAST